MSNELCIEIAPAWLKEANSYMNIQSQYKTNFPDDCFIARGTGKENQHLLAERGIALEYQGASEPVQCFMELRSGGQFRPSNRGAIRAFFSATNAEAGDSISFIKKADRVYQVVLVKRAH